MSNRKSSDAKRRVLNQLVMNPALKHAAKNADVGVTTLFGWLKQSVAKPEKHTLQWLGQMAPFHEHVNAARKLNIVALDAAARDLAINGHVEPKFHDGKPVWKVDPKIAADAKSLDQFDWEMRYGSRERSDTFARDDDGALIQETTTSPPNPQLLVKMLASLAPEVYSERSEVRHVHEGHVWFEGGTPAVAALPSPSINETFGLTQRPDEKKRPTNTLAMPRPCMDSEEFDNRFRRRLLREVVLFRDTENKLLPPLPDDVIVVGTPQHRAFQDAGIEVQAVHPTTLIDEGYENDWLRELAPHHKRKPKPVEVEPIAEVSKAPEPRAMEPKERPGYASSRWDSERIGRGTPPPGGRRVIS